jgi:hypothetical protein
MTQAGVGRCTGIGSTGGSTTGTGITGAGAAGSGGAAGNGAAGSGAANAGFIGLGVAIGRGALISGFGADASTGGGAGAGWVGTIRFSRGVGCRAMSAVRMPIASAISRATTALMATTAIPLPSSRTGLRRG